MNRSMDLAKREFERILIIKPSSLGDVAHALPVLNGLRHRHPRARISWLIATGCRELLQGHPQIDELIPFDRKRYGQMAGSLRISGEFMEFVSSLRDRRFDLVIDLQGLFRSGFLAWASGAKTRIGFARAREFAWLFYSHRVPPGDPDEHAVMRYYRVAPMLGFADVPIEFRLHVPPEARASAESLLADAAVGPGERFALVTPGARWETKIWPAGKIAAVCEYLYRVRGLKIVLAGGPGEMADCRAVAAAAGVPTGNLCGRTSLRDLIALIDASSILISNESGPMHVAVALGRPVAGVVGPTNPRRNGPFSTNSRIVRHALPCSPCYLKKLSQCRHGHACMRGVEAAEVIEAVEALLEQPLPAAEAGR
ncbi:MAG TPA: lipopolysaccharide heptosyltransferase II [Phycisphaerae bacterium]|nr:lipopolysaccharide heptosyltransferase II [Phycisphaerae bacterium]